MLKYMLCLHADSNDELLDECVSCGEHATIYCIAIASLQDVHLAMNNGISIRKEEVMKLRY